MKKARISSIMLLTATLCTLFFLIGCGSGGNSDPTEQETGNAVPMCKGECVSHPESLKDHYGTYKVEISGNWTGTGTLVMNENPYIDSFKISGVSGGAISWYGWLNTDTYTHSETIEDGNYVMYFEYDLPTYVNGNYIGDKPQKLWLYIDIEALETGTFIVSYRSINEVNSETSGTATVMEAYQ